MSDTNANGVNPNDGGRAEAPTQDNGNNNAGNEQTGNAGRANRRGGRGRGNRNSRGAGARGTGFRGATESLSGKVFQLYSEQTSSTEFQDTMDALEIFAATTYKNHVHYLRTIFNDLEAPTVPRPTALDDDADNIDERGLEEDIKAWRKDVRELKNTLVSFFNVVWGQCSAGMQARLRGLASFERLKTEGDVTGLLREIQGISMQFEGSKIIYVAKEQVMKKYYTYVQKQDESNVQFLKHFKKIIEVIKHYGGNVPIDDSLGDYEDDRLGDDAPDDMNAYVRERNIAIAFIHRADPIRYTSLLNRLSNDFALGRDNYPTTLTGAFDMLQTYRGPRLNVRGNPGGGGGGHGSTNIGMQFLQDGANEIVPGRNGRSYPRIQCHNCQAFGHYSNNCPAQSQQNGSQFAMHGVELDMSSDDSSYGPVIAEFMFAQRGAGDLSNYYDSVLIDSGSTCSVFCNDKFLLGIHDSDTVLHATTNGGSQDSTQRGALPGFFDVWYNAASMVNILAWCDVAEHFRITSDTSVDDSILVHVADGCTLRFTMVRNGLFLLDPAGLAKLRSFFDYYSFAQVDTVQALKTNFTRREIEGAERARTLFRALGMPSYAKFIHTLEHNHIRNCPVTSADVRRALHIYGPEVAVLKGKAVRKTPSHVPPTTIIPLPKAIKDFHSNITVYLDFFFVNGLAFFHSISGKYQFRTVQAVHNRKKKTMLECYAKVYKLYKARDINIDEVQADGEFRCIADDVRPALLHVAPPNDHVPEIERSIRTVKERVRCFLHDLPYRVYPKIMVEGCVCNVMKQLNALPADNGISKEMSPATLVTGAAAPEYKNITRMTYGTYAQVFTQSNNSTSARKVGGIALYRDGGPQGGWYFMSLDSGNKIYGNEWTILPVTKEVVARVHALGEEQKQKPIKNGNFSFEWAPNIPITHDASTDDDDDEISIIEPSTEPDEKADVGEIPEPVDDEIPREDAILEPEVSLEAVIHKAEEVSDKAGVAEIIVEEETGAGDALDDEGVPTMQVDVETSSGELHAHDILEDQRSATLLKDKKTEILDDSAEINDDITANELIPKEDNEDMQEERSEPAKVDEPTRRITRSMTAANRNDGEGRYNLRNLDYKDSVNYNKLHNYGKEYFQIAKNLQPKSAKKKAKMAPDRKATIHKRKQKQVHKLYIRDEFKRLVAVCMTQMSAKKGIAKHGEVAVNAILKEYAQLNDLNVFKPRHKDELTKEQIDECLRLITVIKEKRCGKIKGRAVADGRPQRKTIPREDAASPTVSLESLIMTLLVDANEDRDVATADVAGAFLKGDMEDFVLIKLNDEEVDIMCKVNKEYENYVVMEGKRKILYMQLNKALYGCMKSAIIWYVTFVETLKGLGFQLNPYDPCVANLTVDDETLTIVWYVDDCKISHKDPKVVDWLIAEIEKRHDKMTVTRGKKHVFVGMTIEFLGEGKVLIMLGDYLQECIDVSGIDVSEGAKTPATKNLFNVDESSPLLCKMKHDLFHHIVAKLLFVAKRARIDLALTIAFLCTRVSKSTEEDWGKLARLLKYIHSTIDMPRIIQATDLTVLQTWVDASYAVHGDMRSHTGACMSMGRGVFNVKSSKQKLNTKSSTESELIGASDYLPWVIWMKHFLKYQGYELTTNVFYQDNESAMKLEKNGINSQGEKSRHINIRYFFIKDVIKRENIDIKHCPTKDMIADFYTKPLQGFSFVRLRDFIMGLTPELAEERVEKQGVSETSNKGSNPSSCLKPHATYADAVRGQQQHKQ